MSDTVVDAAAVEEEEIVHANGSALIEDGDRELYEQAAARFPLAAHKTELRGGQEITYLEGESLISKMNRTFVYGWESVVVEDGINENADECWARVRVTIWRKASTRTITVVDAKDSARSTTTTTLTEQLIPISREQYGSQKLKRARATGKILDIGFDLKGAATDALKKALSLFGLGLYLWNKEERAMLKALIEEEKAEQRQQSREERQGPRTQDTAQNEPQQGTRRFARPNRTGSQGSAPAATTSPSASTTKPSSGDRQSANDGALVINGKTMPEGFEQPWALMDEGKEQNQCRVEQCETVIDPNADYTVGGESKKGGYVMKRSREMAGCILCAPHAATWFRALQKANTQSTTAA